MLTTFRKTGSVWIEPSSGELLTPDDLTELLDRLPEGALVRVIMRDEDESEDETEALADAFSDDGS